MSIAAIACCMEHNSLVFVLPARLENFTPSLRRVRPQLQIQIWFHGYDGN